MFADPKKNAARRIKRRLKAGASILLALAAGAFLSCKGKKEPDTASPFGPDARSGPGVENEIKPSSSAASTGSSSEPRDSGVAQSGSSTRDAGAAAGARAPHVDKKEHRKGMPVRDNLLE